MNKLTPFVLVFSVITFFNLRAQDKDGIDLESLRAPTAPAATIISIQPNEVVKPKSAKEFEAALMTSYLGEDNSSLSIPNNYMLEATPYWMGDRKNIDIVKDYLNEDIKNLIWKNLSLSVASTQDFRISDSLNTNAIGFGFRTLLKRGDIFEFQDSLIRAVLGRQYAARVNVSLGALLATVETEITNGQLAPKTDGDVFKRVAEIFRATSTYTSFSKSDRENVDLTLLSALVSSKTAFVNVDSTEARMDRFFEELTTAQTAAIKDLYKKFKTDRKGLQLELAGALALNFPTNETDFSTVPKFGFWLTGTFNPTEKKKSDFWNRTSLVVMARYIQNKVDYYQKYFPDSAGYFQNNFDLGFRLIYQKNKFSVEAEFLGRARSSLLDKVTNPDGSVTTTEKSDYDHKYVFNFNYAISDNLIINYSFGRQLEPALKVNGTLISTIGLNLGFGGPKISTE